MDPAPDTLLGELRPEDDTPAILYMLGEDFDDLVAKVGGLLPDRHGVRHLALMRRGALCAEVGEGGDATPDFNGFAAKISLELDAVGASKGGAAASYREQGRATFPFESMTVVVQRVLCSCLVLAFVSEEKEVPRVHEEMARNLRPLQLTLARILLLNREESRGFRCGCHVSDEDINALFND